MRDGRAINIYSMQSIDGAGEYHIKWTKHFRELCPNESCAVHPFLGLTQPYSGTALPRPGNRFEELTEKEQDIRNLNL